MKQNLSITITKIRRRKIMTTAAESGAECPVSPVDELKSEKRLKKRVTKRIGIGLIVAISATALGILLWRYS